MARKIKLRRHRTETPLPEPEKPQIVIPDSCPYRTKLLDIVGTEHFPRVFNGSGLPRAEEYRVRHEVEDEFLSRALVEARSLHIRSGNTFIVNGVEYEVLRYYQVIQLAFCWRPGNVVFTSQVINSVLPAHFKVQDEHADDFMQAIHTEANRMGIGSGYRISVNGRALEFAHFAQGVNTWQPIGENDLTAVNQQEEETVETVVRQRHNIFDVRGFFWGNYIVPEEEWQDFMEAANEGADRWAFNNGFRMIVNGEGFERRRGTAPGEHAWIRYAVSEIEWVGNPRGAPEDRPPSFMIHIASDGHLGFVDDLGSQPDNTGIPLAIQASDDEVVDELLQEATDEAIAEGRVVGATGQSTETTAPVINLTLPELDRDALQLAVFGENGSRLDPSRTIVDSEAHFWGNYTVNEGLVQPFLRVASAETMAIDSYHQGMQNRIVVNGVFYQWITATTDTSVTGEWIRLQETTVEESQVGNPPCIYLARGPARWYLGADVTFAGRGYTIRNGIATRTDGDEEQNYESVAPTHMEAVERDVSVLRREIKMVSRRMRKTEKTRKALSLLAFSSWSATLIVIAMYLIHIWGHA